MAQLSCIGALPCLTKILAELRPILEKDTVITMPPVVYYTIRPHNNIQGGYRYRLDCSIYSEHAVSGSCGCGVPMLWVAWKLL